MGSLLVSLLSGAGGGGSSGGTVAGVILFPVICASTTALTVTYANGALGVGATLTNAGTQAAFSVDGISPTAGQRVLIKNQASAFQNGVYTVTTVGTGATNWVLTRATDFDEASEVTVGIEVTVVSGSTLAASIWVQNATVVTMGSSSITFIQTGAAGAGVSSIAGTANQIAASASTGAVTLSLPSAVTMPGTLTLNADPVSALQAVTKQYADAIAAGIDYKDATIVATTATLNATYLNGVAGVGATLINAGSLVAFSVDGVSPAVNSRILVKNQSSALQNGIYVLTTVGSGVLAWTLTRATDYDQTTEIFPGTLVPVTSGTVNAGTSWLETATVTAIGTDAISFTQFTFANPVTNVTGTAPIASSGGQTPAISLNNTAVAPAAYTLTNLTVDAQGRLTAAASGTAVTSVATGLGLTGGPITTTGTVVLDLTVSTERAYCVVAQTSAVNLTGTYNNGTAGVNATYTNSSTKVALSIDGVLQVVGNRVLIWQQDPTVNGIYTVTTVGSGSVNWVITRATDFDGAINGGIARGVTVWIARGTVNAGSLFMQTDAGPWTIGTTAIDFTQWWPGVGGGSANSVLTNISGASSWAAPYPFTHVVGAPVTGSATLAAGGTYLAYTLTTTLSTPASPAAGDCYLISGGASVGGASGTVKWSVAVQGSQQIVQGPQACTAGSGTVSASNARDSIWLMYIGNNIFNIIFSTSAGLIFT